MAERTSCDITPGLVAEWRADGVSTDFIRRIGPLVGRTMPTGDQFFALIRQALGGGEEALEEWYDTTWRAGRRDCVARWASPVAYKADGSLGQYIVIVPSHGLVAVRQMRCRDGIDPKKDDVFEDFTEKVLAFTGAPGTRANR